MNKIEEIDLYCATRGFCSMQSMVASKKTERCLPACCWGTMSTTNFNHTTFQNDYFGQNSKDGGKLGSLLLFKCQ